MTEYTLDVQKLFLELFLADPESFVRVQNIFNANNFDNPMRKVADFVQQYSLKYNAMPDVYLVNSNLGTNLIKIEDVHDDHISWLMEEFEGFTRRKELERAILQSADYLEKGNYGPVEKLIKDAVQISLHKDMGTNYFDNPRERLMRIKNNNGQTGTGWPSLDKALYGGFCRGELQLWSAVSGGGKSIFLQNMAINYMEKGLNGVYITLELSEELCAMRLDSMLTGIPSKDIFKKMDEVEIRVTRKGKDTGGLMLKYLPAQSNINDIRSYLKELAIKQKFKTDFICVDYLDLLMPSGVKVDASNLFIKDKYVAEEIRNLGKELQLYVFSAVQFNRSGVEEVEFNASNISGGISKVYTADNVFGIFTSRAMRERGKYQLQLMKTRNSSGVGSKIDLDFDVNTLRIIDNGESSSSGDGNKEPSVVDRLRQNSVVSTSNDDTEEDFAPSKKITADVQSNKLNALLNKIKQ